jgi:Circadian oscillating protein COP23
MKKLLAILFAGGLLGANAVTIAPVKAQTGATFYCGSSYDPTSKTNIPTTLIAVSGREEPLALIRWKSEYFPKFTPKERCATISKKFQVAYQAGKLNFLSTGKHKKTGQGIVCALTNAEDSCDSSANMLFTLKPYSSSKLVLSQLTGIVTGESNNPLYQSSGEREVVNMQVLLKSAK